MLTHRLILALIVGTVAVICGVVVYSLAPTVKAQQNPSTAIDIRAQNYTDNVSSITFPLGAPEATVSTPYNNVNGSGSSQTFGDAVTAKPVATLVNTATVPYRIWYNMTTFAPYNVVANEYYLITDKGAGCENASVITNAVTFDANTISIGSTTIAAATDPDASKKDLYLKVILSTVAGKTGTSTITILGEPY
jgi:hypothetical protein